MQSGIRNRMKLVRKAIQKLKAGWAGGDGMQNDWENQYYARPGTTERQPLSQVHCARPRISSLPRGGWGGRTGVSATSAPVRPLDGVADASSMALFHDVRCAYDRSYP